MTPLRRRMIDDLRIRNYYKTVKAVRSEGSAESGSAEHFRAEGIRAGAVAGRRQRQATSGSLYAGLVRATSSANCRLLAAICSISSRT
jgi:hypothetical protein